MQRELALKYPHKNAQELAFLSDHTVHISLSFHLSLTLNRPNSIQIVCCLWLSRICSITYLCDVIQAKIPVLYLHQGLDIFSLSCATWLLPSPHVGRHLAASCEKAPNDCQSQQERLPLPAFQNSIIWALDFVCRIPTTFCLGSSDEGETLDNG